MHIRPGKIWKTSILIFIMFSLLFPASNAFCEYNIYAASYTTYDTTYDDILKMYLRVIPAQCRNQSRRRHDLYNDFIYDELAPYYMEGIMTPEYDRLDKSGKDKKLKELQEKTLQYMKSNVGYAILDINQDGIDEMIIGRDNSYIYELFTMDNGKVRELIKAGARYTCNLLTDGGLYRFARDGAGFYSALLFQMNGTSKVVLDKGYAFNYELAYTNHLKEDDCWFKTNHPDHYSKVSMADHVPTSEASSWIEECESSFAHLHLSHSPHMKKA